MPRLQVCTAYGTRLVGQLGALNDGSISSGDGKHGAPAHFLHTRGRSLCSSFASILHAQHAGASEPQSDHQPQSQITLDHPQITHITHTLAQSCTHTGVPEPQIINYNPKEFDFGKEKPFPLRDQHFFTSVDKVRVCV